MLIMMIYHYAKEEEREKAFEQGVKLLAISKAEGYQTIVFFDRAARPISWLLEDICVAYSQEHLPFVFINFGQKNYRRKYMEGIGDAYSENGRQFVGIYDSPENILLYKERLRKDLKTQQQIKQELGTEGIERMAEKNLLFVDDAEFEGVTRMFAEEMLQLLYEPRQIGYFEFGEMLSHVPNGLSERAYERHFVARPARRNKNVKAAIAGRREISLLVEEFTKEGVMYEDLAYYQLK